MTPTLSTTLSTMAEVVRNDPIVGVCYLGSAVMLVASGVLLVKTVRLRRSIRATLRERAGRVPSVPR